MLKINLLLFLSVFYVGHAQQKVSSVEEIKLTIAKSGGHLRKLECSKSLSLARVALEKAFEINNNELIARSYNIIGLNMDEYYEFNKAIYFFENGLKYANKTQSNFIKYSLHNNIARTYCFRKINFKKGIYHYKKGLNYSKLLKDDYEIMYANLNIATAYFAENNYKNGFPFLKSATSSVINGEELESKITFYSLSGAYYSSKKKFIDSEKAYLKALEFCGENKVEFLADNATEVYDDFSRMYSSKGDFKKAYFYMEKYIFLKEKQNFVEHSNLEKISGTSTILDDYKRKISLVEYEKKLQSKYLNQSKKIGFVLVVLLLLFILLMLTLIQNLRIKKKINNDLSLVNANLEIAKQLSDENLNLKSNFISTVTHELRTPLYGIIGITNILIEIHKELADSPYLNSLKFSANHLLTLVNDLLQYNKLEGQQVILENSVFSLTEEIDTFLFSLQFLANKSNNDVICKIDEKIPSTIAGDFLRLSQILINLVGNAVKFTKNGTIKISADLVSTDCKHCYIRFEVTDNGIGIDDVNHSRIFDSFVQLTPNSTEYQGTGLGLSIVKKLIELFGSEIFLNSKLGEGSSFYFTIAFEIVNSDSNEFIRNLEEESKFSGISILLVEDNLINQMVSKKIIKNLNYKCTVANEGFEALRFLKNEKFDIILMDINMPVMNGYEASKKIRKLKIKTPIIALTAFSENEIKDYAFNAGIDAVISKPVKPAELKQVIINQLLKTKNVD